MKSQMAAKKQRTWNDCFSKMFNCGPNIIPVFVLVAALVPWILYMFCLKVPVKPTPTSKLDTRLVMTKDDQSDKNSNVPIKPTPKFITKTRSLILKKDDQGDKNSNVPVQPIPKFKPDARSLDTKKDDYGDKNSNEKRRSHCSQRTSKWEYHLAIDCNKDTRNATTPETLLQNFCDSLDKKYKYSSWPSAKFSRVYVHDHEQGISNTVSVSIETFDREKKRKDFGYDLIVIRAEQNGGDGRSSGVVMNFKNGSYLGTVNVFWTGSTSVYAKIVSPIQNTCLRQAAIKKYGTAKYSMKGIRILSGRFGNGNFSELRECNPNSFVFGSDKLCNFTSLNDGMSWFCGHPKNKFLACSNIKHFQEQDLNLNNTAERTIKPFLVEFRPLKVSSEKSIWRSNINNGTACNKRDPIETWKEPLPTGFWLNGSWNFVRCYSTLKHTVDEYRVCLRNTSIIFLGDSTIRQYANYFRTHIMNLTKRLAPDTYGHNEFHRYGIEQNFGINLMSFKHEMPLHFGTVPWKGIVSISKLIDSFIDNKDVVKTNVVLLFGYYTHLSPFPPVAFRERVRKLAGAIERFLKVKPLTKVFFKGPHLTLWDKRWFDPRNARLFRLIVEEEFSNILHKVIYLDTWDITVAHGNVNVHPHGDAFESQVQQIMSYIC